MMKYTFQPRVGPERTIEAATEEAARQVCMEKTYGPSTYGHPYRGAGLLLVNVKP